MASVDVFAVIAEKYVPNTGATGSDADLKITLDSSANKLTFVADGEDKDFTLANGTEDNGVYSAKVQGLDTLLNLKIGGWAADEARIEYRADKPDSGWNTTAPHFTLSLCGTLAGETEKTIEHSGGTIDAGLAVAFRVCAGVAFIAPPDEAGGISNLAVRLNLPDFGIGSGWIPLSVLDLGQLSDFRMPGVLKWFEDLIPDINFGEFSVDVDWDVDLPLDFDLPLGIRPLSSTFFLKEDGGTYRVMARVSGLELLWDGKEVLTYEAFELKAEWDGGKYLVAATLLKDQYPKENGKAPYGFALPFGTLSVTANAWFLRFGLFGHKDGDDWRFCFDTVLEIGGLSVAAPLFDEDPLYKTDLRLHLRDLSVMTGEFAADTEFFSEADRSFDAFAPYVGKKMPGFTFVKDLQAPPPEPETPNDYGIEILDGDFRSGERIFLAWKQHSVSRMFKALMHDLIGTEAAGALPGDAEMVTLGLEIAWFGGGANCDTQVRLDLRPEAPATGGGTSITWTPGGICFEDPNDLKKGLVLPGGVISTGTLDNVSTGEDAFAVGLAGLEMRVRRPDTHTLVYRAEGDGTDSLAWVVAWSDPGALADGDALAEASLDFSFTPNDGKRQVQPADQGKLFRVVLGNHQADSKARAIQLIGWREGEGLRFFQTYNGTRPFAILPDATATPTPLSECPQPPAPVLAPVPLTPGVFGSFSLEANDGQYLLGISSRISNALLSQFGSDRAVSFEIEKICLSDDRDALVISTKLSVSLSEDTELSGGMDFRLRLADLALSVEDGATLGLERDLGAMPGFIKRLNSTPSQGKKLVVTEAFNLFGFDLYGLTELPADDTRDSIQLLTLSMEDGAFTLRTPEGTQLLLRYDDFGDDGLTFSVDRLVMGAGGLDLEAELLATTLKLPGLQKPFALDQARLEIVGGRMTDLTIAGSGQMPELLNSAPVSIAISLKQGDDGRIRLADFDCELGNGDAPIFSRGTRCRFELTKVTIDMDNAGGTRPDAWFFRISGSLQMQPEGIEFLGNLLEDFKSIRMEFTDAPLGDEFFEHIELIATLNKPASFNVLNLFDMEVRSVGFHPKFEGFEEDAPAIIIGGQIKFADIGDLLSVDVDFHRLYLGLPKKGEVIPQTYAKGLRVDISTSGFKIAGRVDYWKTDLVDGFGGEGTVLIPGLPELSAAFAFAKLRAVNTDGWKRGWFIAIEAGRISYQTGPLPLYLRQIGLGFGYRYTSVLIKKFESEDRLGPLIELMLREIENHHSLARLDSWAPDAERDGQQSRWSIGLEAMFSMASANTTPTTYNKEGELQFQSVLAQMLLFLRSDFTFMAAAKLWFPVSADDWFENLEDMRRRPLALGFMAYSAPKSRLLIHAAKGRDPYLGRQPGPLAAYLKEMLDNSHFEVTFLSEPGLIHAELGWPDRLFFKYRIGALTIECRGGVLFRLEKDLLVQGVYFSARGEVTVSAGLSLGIVGTQISAHISVSFAMRLMMGISLSKPLDSNIYAAVGLDISVRFSIHIWFRLNLRFFKISIDIRFSLEIQIVVALEIGWAGQGDLGFRAQASVMIAAFGRGLKVKINVSAGTGVENARAALAPYMRSFLEPGAIPPIPGLDMVQPERVLVRADGSEVTAEGPAVLAPMAAPLAGEPAPPPPAEPLVVMEHQRSDPPKASFVFAIKEGRAQAAAKKLWFGWVMPSPVTPENGNTPLYPPVHYASGNPADTKPYAKMRVPLTPDAKLFVPVAGEDGAVTWDLQDTEVTDPDTGETMTQMAMNIRPFASAILEEEGSANTAELTLQKLLAGCYVPKDSDNFGEDVPYTQGQDRGPFPMNWTGFALDGASLDVASDRIADERLAEPGSEALGTRRRLDPDHVYDRALMDAIEAAEPQNADGFNGNNDSKRAHLVEQALGNQAYLFRSFMDDLTWFAERTTLDGEVPKTQALSGRGRPTLADLGTVVCVLAEDCPDWLCRFPDGAAPAKLTIEDGVINGWKVDTPVPPVIDFTESSFELSPPDMRAGHSYVDDETLVFIWSIDWRKTPGSVIDNPDIEDFLDHYYVEIYQEGSDQPLETAVLNPCDLLAPPDPDNPGLRRLQTRFQYVRKIGALGIDKDRLRSRALGIRAYIVPVAQDGSRSDEALEAVAEYRASATPLPADGGAVRLEKDGDALKGALYWRQPTPPNDPSVALTKRWELILRPIRPLPLGAYPAETAETEDTALASLGPPGLKDGDIIVTFTGAEYEGTPPDIWQDDAGVDQVNVNRIYSLPLDQTWSHMVSQYDAVIYDHRGEPTNEESSAHKLAVAFFERRSATESDGAGWRIFLRSSSEDLPPLGADLPESGYGALSRVSLLLVMPPDTDAEDGATTRFRALDHLEWPQKQDVTQIDYDDLRDQVGGVALAAIAEDGGDLKLEYQTLPGTDRAVTLTWNAVPSAGGVVEDTARFILHEARVDRLVNLDRAKDIDGFGVESQEIKQVQLIDQPYAARSTTSFVQPEVWDHIPPVRRRTLKLLSHIPPEQKTELWPGWYSFAESALLWPEIDFASVQTLSARVKHLEKAPLLTLQEVLEKGQDRTAEDALDYLTSIFALGRHTARRSLHPWLKALVGEISRQGAPTYLGGDSDALAQPRFEVEITPGKPGPLDDKTTPVQWMQNDVESLDPLGWGGLSYLGLATTLALRDPVTGLYQGQDFVRERLSKAAGTVNQIISEIGDTAGNLRVGIDMRHLALDLPLQTSFALRSSEGDRRLDNAAALSMVQISLRPIPRPFSVTGSDAAHQPAVQYGAMTLKSDGTKTKPEGEFTLPADLTAIYPNDNGVVRTFAAGTPTPWENLFGATRGAILLRWDHADAAPIAHLASLWPGEAGTFPYEPITHNDQDVASAPLAALDIVKGELPLTPFGRFDVDVKAWKTVLDEPENAAFTRFLTYLAIAFVRQDSDKPPAEAATTLLNAINDLIAELRAHPDMAKTYLGWAARYFAAAPMAGAETALLDPARLTAATPKRDEPTVLAPDDLGRLSYTHFIAEHWASLRSYAVQRVPRYRQLLQPEAALPLPEFSAEKGKLDVAIPRRRKIRPPKLIGLRVLTDPTTKRHYHEITESEHVEEALSQASTTLARKLEFQDLLHHFDIAFRRNDWLDRLAANDQLIPNELKHSSAGTGEMPQVTPPRGLGEDDFLEHVPMARFGARRFVVSAEPFYYVQNVSMSARAVAVTSPVVTARLPRPPAAPPTPDGDPLAWNKEDPTWADLGLADLNQTATVWLKQIKADNAGLAAALAPLMKKPQGLVTEVRFPRLFELLPKASLTSHFSAEKDANSYGRVPDPQGRLELISTRATGRNSLASIAAAPAVIECFETHSLSQDHQITIKPVANRTVPASDIAFDVGLCRQVSVLAGDLSLRDPVLSGPLARLSALRLRLSQEDDQIKLIAPGIPNRWAFRLTGDIASNTKPAATDVATGLRILLHPFHQAASIEAVTAFDDPLTSLENDAVPALSVALEADGTLTHDFDGYKLWHWTAETNTWSLVAAETDIAYVVGDRLLLRVPGIAKAAQLTLSDDDKAALTEFATRVDLQVGRLTAKDAVDHLTRINGLGALVVDASLPESVQFVAHHGNIPGAEWGEEGVLNDD